MTSKTDTAVSPAVTADDSLVTFIPSANFRGYPFPHAKMREREGTNFIKNQKSIPVPQAFVDLMRDKGLVADKSTKADAGEKSKA
jgi:hypothetical protein